MTKKERVAQTLRKAKELMNNKGAHWVRHDLRTRKYDDTGDPESEYSYCSLGAIFQVTGVDLDKVLYWDPVEGNVYERDDEKTRDIFQAGDADFRNSVIKTLHDEILATGYTRPHSQPKPPTPYDEWFWTITSWNDCGAREWDEVAEMFENAAKSAER